MISFRTFSRRKIAEERGLKSADEREEVKEENQNFLLLIFCLYFKLSTTINQFVAIY